MGNIIFPQFQKSKEGLKLHPGLTILELAQMEGVRINAEWFPLKEKERFACQARIVRDVSDMVVYIKDFGEYDILKYGMERDIPVSPLYTKKGDKVFRDGVEVDDYRGKIYGLAVDVGTTTIVFDLVNLENGDVLPIRRYPTATT